jgi:hypothetical protein
MQQIGISALVILVVIALAIQYNGSVEQTNPGAMATDDALQLPDSPESARLERQYVEFLNDLATHTEKTAALASCIDETQFESLRAELEAKFTTAGWNFEMTRSPSGLCEIVICNPEEYRVMAWGLNGKGHSRSEMIRHFGSRKYAQ